MHLNKGITLILMRDTLILSVFLIMLPASWEAVPAQWPNWADGFLCFASGAVVSALLALPARRGRARVLAAKVLRHRALQARIRPHFLFNTLNSAMALLRAEPAKAEAVLQDLSDLFRQALKEEGESVSLADEVDLAQRYLAMERLRFGPRIQAQWVLDEAASQARLPPLSLQPLLENALVHGVEPSLSGAKIKISSRRAGAVVVVTVVNTVPQGVGQKGSGLALANVRERLTLLHGPQARLESGFKNGVFQVRMVLPL